VALSLLSGSAAAMGPHELLVLANENSEGSVTIARRYMEWRRIPPSNLVLLKLPAPYAEGQTGMGLDEFKRLILNPASKAVRQRGIDDHILAWVYSTGFPTRIDTPERISILGATFLRGEPPVAEAILKAQYASPLFAGPEWLRGTISAPQTFDQYAKWINRDMPLPSMMLGYTGERGNTGEEVASALWKGVQSDRTHPTGTVYFVTTGDKRSPCREWQYEGAKRELAQKGVAAVVTASFPEGKRDVLGLMTGTASVKPGRVKGYVPGSLAEHLTSFAGAFEQASQSKMSLWIRDGATLSAGTVTEPRAMYHKFPTARFYVYYAQGCTAIESFYQALRCPLQILLLGDPLASPWAVSDEVVLAELPVAPVSVPFVVSALLKRSDPMRFYSRYLWLVDGRVVGEGKRLQIETAGLTPGAHQLRVVAYSTGLVRHQIFAVEEFTVQ